MEHLFDITTETNLMTEIKDILDELNIISSVGRQQTSVIKPFMRDMLNQSLDTQDKSFHDSTRLEMQIEELQKTAKSTYRAVSDIRYQSLSNAYSAKLQDLLDLKQKQASVIEARAARKDAKSSADQAEASTSLTYETVKQGWSIMIFTIVTIIFVSPAYSSIWPPANTLQLPLSFFTGLFGMNVRSYPSLYQNIIKTINHRPENFSRASIRLGSIPSSCVSPAPLSAHLPPNLLR
jgi:Mg2+ and Co2+ transporter CorA